MIGVLQFLDVGDPRDVPLVDRDHVAPGGQDPVAEGIVRPRQRVADLGEAAVARPLAFPLPQGLLAEAAGEPLAPDAVERAGEPLEAITINFFGGISWIH